MSRARARRLARQQAVRDALRRPYVSPEVRQLADELGVYLGDDEELRELHRGEDPRQVAAEVRELAEALGVDLDGP